LCYNKFSMHSFSAHKLGLSLPRYVSKALFTIFIWAFLSGFIATAIFIIYLKNTLPDPESISTRKLSESAKIYDRTGEVLLYDIYDEEKRTIIPWEKIPNNLKKATLAAEDSDFYSHKGLEIKSILRAILKNLESGQLSQGGSTITQQLVKNSLLGQEKTFSRKLRELMLSVEVERKFSKDQIFWMYLNQIPYGSNAYGIYAASRTFFGKDPDTLTISEAAILAALPQAPSYYSPFGSHVGETIERRNWILEKMRDLKFISPEEYSAAIKDRPSFSATKSVFSAPHFVVMIKEYLIKKYGEERVANSGFKIISTLDADLQEAAEGSVKKYAEINKKKYKAGNAALVAIDPKTGDVLSLVGSSDYFNTENQGNFNVITAKRQPGSAFKPFAYAEAFKKGYADYSALFDVPTEFNPNCPSSATQQKDSLGVDCYHPQNYDGRFRGPVTFRQGLAQSLNVPSVKVLYLAGISDTINLAEKMGITTLGERDRFGLSLVLGGAEVRPIDIVSAYGIFANDGIRNPWSLIKKIELNDGTLLEEENVSPTRVLDSQIARLISDILSDNNARTPVFGAISSLYFPDYNVAAKTGTTQNNRDAWVIGYTPSLVAGVWTGNNDNASLTKEGAGISASGPMWHEFMVNALKNFPQAPFLSPDPVPSNEKPMLNGIYKISDDPSVPAEIHSILYFVDPKNPLGASPQNPAGDSQFANWEEAIQQNRQLVP